MDIRSAVEPEILTPDQIPVPAVTSIPEIESLAERFALEAQTDLRMAQAVQVVDDASYQQAGELRVAIDRKKKGGEGVVEIICSPLYAKWKAFRMLLMRPVETRTEALKVLSDRRMAYDRKKQEEAERERRRLEEEARKEQERLNKLALDRAQRAEARGDTAKAEEILESVPQVSVPIAPVAEVPKVKGIAKQEYFWAEVTDLKSLVTGVAAGEIPLDAILPNTSWLNKTANALKKNMKYAGVIVKSEWREKSTGR